MSTATTIEATSKAYDELRQAIDRVMRGERDPQATRMACDRMDRMREELQARTGTVEVAVDLIRDARNP
jgi:hypothetical protein